MLHAGSGGPSATTAAGGRDDGGERRKGSERPFGSPGAGYHRQSHEGRETTGKEQENMAKTRDKVYDAAGNVKPYVDRAMKDEKLRDDVMSAFGTARELYNELVGGRTAVTLATRVATDEELRDKLKDAVDDLRNAADRLQGKKDHGGRNTTLLIAGIALGILFNPVTGSGTRRWVKDLIGGGGNDQGGGDYGANASSNGGA